MRKINGRLMEASSICGAGPTRSFLRVYLPLSLPGLLAGALLTFTLSLGFYITPALLGGPRDTMIAQLIAIQVGEQLNFGMASALAVVVLVLTAAAFGLFGLVMKIGSATRRRATGPFMDTTIRALSGSDKPRCMRPSQLPLANC